MGVTFILASFAPSVLQRFGVSEKTSLMLAFVFGVTLFWMLVMYWMWAFVEGENRRRNQKQ